jgi:hypothetical protein
MARGQAPSIRTRRALGCVSSEPYHSEIERHVPGHIAARPPVPCGISDAVSLWSRDAEAGDEQCRYWCSAQGYSSRFFWRFSVASCWCRCLRAEIIPPRGAKLFAFWRASSSSLHSMPPCGTHWRHSAFGCRSGAKAGSPPVEVPPPISPRNDASA